jgi:hypothetical protein
MPAHPPDDDLPELAPPGLWARLRESFHRRPDVGNRRQHRIGYAMRVEWPRGEHDFVCFDPTPAAAERRVPGYFRYWAAGPYKPVSITVVAISRHDWELHRRRRQCRAPDCPINTKHRLAQDGCEQA